MRFKITASVRYLLFTILSFVLLLVYLQVNFKYHFFYIEQFQLFQYSSDYASSRLSVPGGFVQLLDEFLTQFYVLPFVGAVVTSLTLTLVAVLFISICRKIAPSITFYFLYALPVLFLLFVQLDIDYQPGGTLAYLLALCVFRGYLHYPSFKGRMIYALLSIPLLLWTGGAVVILYGIGILLWELLNRPRHWYWVFPFLALIVVLTLATVYFARTGSVRLAFLPDMYYNPVRLPQRVIYYSWIALPVAVLIAFFFRKDSPLPFRKELLSTIGQLLLIAGMAVFFVPKYTHDDLKKTKQLDYLSRGEQWDNVIELGREDLTNNIDLLLLNNALLAKDVLADSLFFFDQSGVKGLFLNWNQATSVPALFSDRHFSMDNTASAQQTAFEGYITAKNDGSPRMLKRLVQTNLIYTSWSVAERYLAVLENTLYYKEWAKQHRMFLHNEEALLQDSLLGGKRRALMKKDMLSDPNNPERDLLALAENNPQNKRPIEYLLSIFLLDKDHGAFQEIVERYYGTDVLPRLPVSFQEALLLFSMNEEAPVLERYAFSEEIIARFEAFKAQVLNNQNPHDARRVAQRDYRHTYWYYCLFK